MMMTKMFSKETIFLIERMKSGRLLSDADRCRVRLELMEKLKEINRTLWERTRDENKKIQDITGEVVALLEKDHFESLEAQK